MLCVGKQQDTDTGYNCNETGTTLLHKKPPYFGQSSNSDSKYYSITVDRKIIRKQGISAPVAYTFPSAYRVLYRLQVYMLEENN